MRRLLTSPPRRKLLAVTLSMSFKNWHQIFLCLGRLEYNSVSNENVRHATASYWGFTLSALLWLWWFSSKVVYFLRLFKFISFLRLQRMWFLGGTGLLTPLLFTLTTLFSCSYSAFLSPSTVRTRTVVKFYIKSILEIQHLIQVDIFARVNWPYYT